MTGEDRVRTVFALREDGIGQRTIAARLGISRSAVNKILTGRSYRGVAPELERYVPVSLRYCTSCALHAGGDHGCSLGIPEALDSHCWATHCPTYMPAPSDAA